MFTKRKGKAHKISKQKRTTMAKRSNTDQGKSSGNKPMEGTGIPSKINDDNMAQVERLTDAYTDNDEDVSEGVRTLHPNRNADKDHQPGTGGY